MTNWIDNFLSLIEFLADRALATPIIYFVALLVFAVIVDCFRRLIR